MLLAILLVLVACTDIQDNDSEIQVNGETKNQQYVDLSHVPKSMKELLEQYPGQKAILNEIPVQYQKQLYVPALSDIPYDIKEVKVVREDFHEMISTIAIYIDGEEKRVAIKITQGGGELSTGSSTEIELINGVVARYRDHGNANGIGISWIDESVERAPYTYLVGFVTIDFETFQNKENKFKKEDAIQVVNSMLEENVN